jgi:DNA polymerase I-like protein with 3'-5' exonuclease and polymerase domains
MHCIVTENHQTGEIIAFYNGDTYELDGRKYSEKGRSIDVDYVLENYKPVKYVHKQLNEFKSYIESNKINKVVAHNGINYDHLVCKLYYGMDYQVEPDSWCGKPTEIVDTMVLSKTLNPDRFGGHSLDNLSEKVGLRKIDFRPYIKDKQKKFEEFAADMLYYCIRDVLVNTKVYKYLEKEKGNWEWDDPIRLEKKVADIVTRQEHRGFAFNRKLAEDSVEELDKMMEEHRVTVEPVLPPRKATKKFLSDHTPPVNQVKVVTVEPPKTQFKKSGDVSAIMLKFIDKNNGKLLDDRKCTLYGKTYTLPIKQGTVIKEERTLSNHMVNFLDRHEGSVNEANTEVTLYGKTYALPMDLEPVKTSMVATINDSTHIKGWLVEEFGWVPSEFKEKDLYERKTKTAKIKRTRQEFEEAVDKYVEETLNSPLCKERLDLLETTRTRLKAKLLRTKDGGMCKVPTNPNFTKGQEKEICPNLDKLSDKFPYARNIVEYMTYKHRRNSILGGGLEWDEEGEAEKGYMAYIREDGRIATPAGTCDAATSRMKHRVVANIPRVTSLYGSNMRSLFGAGEGYYQIGYDFDSLEAKIESHYCWRYDPTKEYCNSLTLEKPNDCHTKLAEKISDLLGTDFPRGSAKSVKYGCSYNAQPPRVARTVGCDLPTAQVIFDTFWDQAFPLNQLKKNMQRYWETKGQKKFLLGLDGRKLPVRSKGNVINTAFQSAGVIAAKRAMVIHEELLRENNLIVDFFKDDWKKKDFCQQMIAMHDEAQLEVNKDQVTFKIFNYPEGFKDMDKDDKKLHTKKLKQEAQQFKDTEFKSNSKIWSDIVANDKCVFVAYSKAGQLAAEAVQRTGDYYKLNIELTAGYIIGRDWAECH